MLRASRIPQLRDIEEARLQGLNDLFGSMVAPSFADIVNPLFEVDPFIAEIGEALVTGSELF